MEDFSLQEVITATKGKWLGNTDPNQIFPTGGERDNRTLKKGELFFALPGEHVDGHQFIDEALKSGASAGIVSRQWFEAQNDRPPKPLIIVESPELAMGDVARAYRKKFDIPVIGITGSNGKTTTKDMVAAVLKTQYYILVTEGNLNNQLGVPLTLFRLNAQHEVAVIEMGISDFGEMQYLCDIAQPTIGIITNVGPTHLEFLGSVEGVAKAKGELLEYLDESSMTILNLDDLLLSKERVKVKGRLLGFGIERNSQFRGEGLSLNQERRGHFTLQGRFFKLTVPGRHNVYNALAAATAGVALHVPLENAAKALANFEPTKLRSQVLSQNGLHLINDTYNANPASMQAALDVLADIEIPEGGRRIAILGDMRELGEITDQAHQDLGKETASKADVLFALGDHAHLVIEAAQSAGLSSTMSHAFTDSEALISTLKEFITSGDTLLIKGSRGLAMEHIVEALGFKL
ncbi:MAG: UDP-N-acetylmuramoyl-tripeptide--D-alanyl-D-alanine ligase [Candidatus Latescibacteria bacterium]|jgi:UDP-N-acetylmuramoyl-tripeptide--D-alanyl-D-alanine ligase|nr:UDP-N-acetylmuramoyl-tripeptide--D-alanyl-D-alanine ligase [Candidatus Latescibacterota bacterium]